MQEGADTMSDELLTVYEKRRELARIVRKQERMTRHYKFKDRIEEKEVPVDSPFAILRAIELDTRLEAASQKMQAECCAEQPGERPEQPEDLLPKRPEGFTGLMWYDGTKHARTNIPT